MLTQCARDVTCTVYFSWWVKVEKNCHIGTVWISLLPVKMQNIEYRSVLGGHGDIH